MRTRERQQNPQEQSRRGSNQRRGRNTKEPTKRCNELTESTRGLPENASTVPGISEQPAPEQEHEETHKKVQRVGRVRESVARERQDSPTRCFTKTEDYQPSETNWLNRNTCPQVLWTRTLLVGSPNSASTQASVALERMTHASGQFYGPPFGDSDASFQPTEMRRSMLLSNGACKCACELVFLEPNIHTCQE